ncbi:LysR substrate-binding domain-containing protein [Micromonospora sp. 067-2]|uniref:LysR substrate-binding domain-containing protein n=1 Tax=Micromonospora sp. 067-2 TaxID=2789270 RepID=UPI00397C76DF
MDVRRLRLLRELSRLGTASAVAELYFLSPSAVSQQLSTLEREVGVTLLRRVGRRLTLTAAGELLVKHADQILADLERAEADLAALHVELQGRVRLAAFPTVSRLFMVPALTAARREHPELTIAFEEMGTHEAMEALRRENLDAALIYDYEVLGPISAPGLEIVTMFRERIVLLVGEGESRRPTRLAELADRRWIAPRADTLCHAAFVALCEAAGFTPRIDVLTNDSQLTHNLVAGGIGVALVPTTGLVGMPGTLRSVALEDPGLERRVCFASRTGGQRRPAIIRMFDTFLRLSEDYQDL